MKPTTYQVKRLSGLLKKNYGLKKTRAIAKRELTYLSKHDKILRLSFGQDYLGVFTKSLILHAPNGKTTKLGNFKLVVFFKDYGPYISGHNLTNARKYKNYTLAHPNGGQMAICMGDSVDQQTYRALTEGNIYWAIDLYIHALENFNPNDGGVLAGLWFKGRQYGTIQALQKDLIQPLK